MTVTGETILAGIMGWPVAHSRSPQLHGYWLEKYGINGLVVPLAVRAERLEVAVRGLPALGFRGSNVTIPHKEAVAAHLDRVTDVAARIGAVNTIMVAEDGTLTGTNTDAFGFMAHLKQSVPDWRPEASAVVLGAGGAARAVVAALLDEGVPEIRLLNRTRERAESFAAHFGAAGITVLDWDMRAKALLDAGLLVNATSLGMTGKAALDLSLDGLSAEAVVYDLVYSPLRTPLLAAAQTRGAITVDGLGMLLHQARPAFEAWFGRDPAVDAGLRDHLVRDLGIAQ